MEHSQQLIEDGYCYVLKIEVLVFRVIDVRLDFTGSKNIKLVDNTQSLKNQAKVKPFSKETVACLQLSKGWMLEFKVEVDRHRPSVETLIEYLTNSDSDLCNAVSQFKFRFKDINLKALPANALLLILEQKESNFIDLEFPPSVSITFDKPEECSTMPTHW